MFYNNVKQLVDYLVSSVGNVCSETIKKYVESQKTRY